MVCEHRHTFFGALYVIGFVAAIHLCTGWTMDLTTFASLGVIACAEAIVLGMLYVNVFYGEHTEAPAKPELVKASIQALPVHTYEHAGAH